MSPATAWSGVTRAVLAATAILVIGCAGVPPTVPEGTPAATVDIAADNLAFDRDTLTVPADAPFAIRFDNRESVPHNVSIYGDEPHFVGELFGGPAERTYQVRALPAGEYRFICDLHPEMAGTLISE